MKKMYLIRWNKSYCRLPG